MRTNRMIFLGALAAFSLSGAALGVGCSGGDNTASGSANTGGNSSGTSQGGGGNGQGGSGNGGQGGEGGDINFFDAGPGDGGLTEDSACVSQSSEATLVKKPVDIIIVIDNSGSMENEIIGVQNNINQNFAQIIENSGLDYRVIMISTHGASSAESICIEAPLSGIPAGGCSPPPTTPVNNPGKYYHYSTEIGSHDSFCKILTTFNIADPNGAAPTGWKEWLRPDSFKTFIELTDDGVGACTATGVSFDDNDNVNDGTTSAAKFDTALLALSPENFGTAEARNYRFYSIVAMAFNDPANKPWEPADPITTLRCANSTDAPGPGTGYQALSILTGGLRFPLCDTTSYDAVFQAIADGVVSGAQVACNFAIPDPPEGTTVDLSSVVVDYTPGDMSPKQQFAQVADAAACAANSFYIDKMANQIILCPDTCGVLKNDAGAKVAVLFACDPGGAN